MLALGGFLSLPQVSLPGVAGDTNFDRHCGGIDHVTAREDRHALHCVAQLADVDGPGVAFQLVEDFRIERLGLEIVASTKLAQEIFRQCTNILAALAQTGDPYRYYA